MSSPNGTYHSARTIYNFVTYIVVLFDVKWIFIKSVLVYYHVLCTFIHKCCFFELTTQQKERDANMWCRKAKKKAQYGVNLSTKNKFVLGKGSQKKYGNVSRRLNLM